MLQQKNQYLRWQLSTDWGPYTQTQRSCDSCCLWRVTFSESFRTSLHHALSMYFTILQAGLGSLTHFAIHQLWSLLLAFDSLLAYLSCNCIHTNTVFLHLVLPFDLGISPMAYLHGSFSTPHSQFSFSSLHSQFSFFTPHYQFSFSTPHSQFSFSTPHSQFLFSDSVLSAGDVSLSVSQSVK